MVVYVEYAFAENFLIDGLILFLALKIARGRVKWWRLLLAAAVGATEAIVFPLIPLPVWCAYLVKILGGVLLCVLVVSKGRLRTYIIVTVAFFLMTFAFGGLLTAAYSFFNVEYEEGSGYLVEQAPVALVFAALGIFAVAVVLFAKYFYRHAKLQRNLCDCVLEHGERKVNWKGLYDSGNLLEFRGKPVCVISAAAAFALYGRSMQEVGRMELKTVNGMRNAPVFTCERMKLGAREFEEVFLTVGEVAGKDYQVILHSNYMEGSNEITADVAGVAETRRGKRKRRTLPLRK